MDAFRTYRQFERFLFLTPHDAKDELEKDTLIATITYDFENKKVIVTRVDDKEHPVEM
jgi:hypothetical protein